MKKLIALLLALIIMCFSLIACNDNTNDDTKETETTEQTPKDFVDLTPENIDTYFEFIEESFFTKDSSGKYSQLRFRHYYKLRDEYNIDLSKSSVKLVYNYSSAIKNVDINFDTQTFTLGEQIGEKTNLQNIVIDKISQLTYKDYAILLLQPTHASKGDTKIEFFSDFELISVEGKLHFIDVKEVDVHPTESHSH
jgi:hypothetical protein